MRPFLLVLLVDVCVSVDDSYSKRSNMVERFKEHLKGNRATKARGLLNRLEEDLESVPKLWKNLSKCEGALQTGIALSSEQKEFLERVSHVRGFEKAPRMESSIESVNAKSGIADALFQADMLLSKDQQEHVVKESESRAKRQASNDKTYPGKRWPDVVSYTLDGTLDNYTKEAFKNATYLWMNDTCIDFMEDTSEEAQDIILVYKHDGCWAEVGRHGGWQLISLGEDCDTVGIAAHEIGHALGFSHTHARHDRDQFVTIIEENVNCSLLRQFEAKTPDTNNNYNLTYDYGSVMHYEASSFVNESIGAEKPTIIPADELYTETLGSPIISFYDLLMMNIYYNCTGKCKDHETDKKCLNGGFPHPRNCSKCICPSGYGGQFCNERPQGCGAVLNAAQNWTTLENPLNRTEAGKDGFMRCNYWITAPDNKTIEVKIADLKVPGAIYYKGCKKAGVEIKTNSDQRRTGYRFCSTNAVNTTLNSTSSMVPVITFINERFLTELEGLPDDYYEDDGYGEEGEDDYNGDGREANEKSEENEGTDMEDLSTGVKLEYRYV